jgi:signal transduction histidine kinase
VHYLLVDVLTRLGAGRFRLAHRVDLVVLPLVFLVDVLVFSRLLRPDGVTAAERVAIVIFSAAGVALLLFRWRAPVLVFAAAVVVSLPPLLVTDYYIPFLIPLIALAAVAQLRPPRVSLWCLVATAVPIALLVGNAVMHASEGGRLTSAVGSTVFYAAGFVLAWTFGWWSGRHQRRLAEIEAAHRHEVDEQRAIADQAVSVERLRIARELHDIVAHSVTIMVLHAAGAQRVVRTDPDRAADSLALIEDSGQRAMGELRRLLALLRETEEDSREEPGTPGLAQVDQVLAAVRGSGVTASLEVSGEPRRLDTSVDLAAYRLIQEALTNVTKHLGAGARVVVTIEWEPEKVTVAVEDDGVGVRSPAASAGHPDGSAGGHGLAGLRERVAIAAGDFSAGPTDAGGFRVAARLPVSAGTGAAPPRLATRAAGPVIAPADGADR